jgi:hypothetical protein
MQAMVAIVFRVLFFPHEDQIVTIHQLYFSIYDPSLGVFMVLVIDNRQPGIVNIEVGLFPSLMGTFNYPPPQGNVKFIFDHNKVEIFQVSSFRMTYFTNPWILPSPSTTVKEIGHSRMSMPLSIAEVAYSLVQQASANPDPTHAQEFDPLLQPIWAQGSLTDTNSLELVLPSNEAIIEAMTSPDKP